MKIELGVISKEARKSPIKSHNEAGCVDVAFFIIEQMINYGFQCYNETFTVKGKKFKMIIEEDLEGDK